MVIGGGGVGVCGGGGRGGGEWAAGKQGEGHAVQ